MWSDRTTRRVTRAIVLLIGALILLYAFAQWRLRTAALGAARRTEQVGHVVVAAAFGVAAGLLGRRWRISVFAISWLALALAFGGLVLVYWVSTLPTSDHLTNSSYRTIVSLLVGAPALLPLLFAPTEAARRLQGDSEAGPRTP